MFQHHHCFFGSVHNAGKTGMKLEVRQNMKNKQPCLRLFHAVMRSRKKAGNNEFNEC